MTTTPTEPSLVPAAHEKPLRYYLDRGLFGLMALAVWWAGNRLDSYGSKLEANTQEITALRERVEGLKERVATLERIATLKEKHDGR